MPGYATVLSSWTTALLQTLKAQGVDGTALLRQAGLDPALLDDPNARYPVDSHAELWRLAVQATGNEAIGLQVAAHAKPTTFHALGYSISASASLLEVFERVQRYFRIVTDAAEFEVIRKGETYTLNARVPPERVRPAPQSLDAFMALLVRFCRELYPGEFRLCGLRLQHPAPGDLQPYIDYFGVVPEFDAPVNGLCVPAGIAETRLPTGNPELARISDQVAREYLARLDKENISNRVHVLLTQMLPSGTASQENIARELHMSLRSLQRKLADEGVTYKELLDTTRRDLALSYMREGKRSVSELTFLLGFSDSSSFARAFKRWTGRSPREYKASLAAS